MAEEKVFTTLQKRIVPQVDDWIRKIDQRIHLTVQLVNTKSGTRRVRQLEMISFLSSNYVHLFLRLVVGCSGSSRSKKK